MSVYSTSNIVPEILFREWDVGQVVSTIKSGYFHKKGTVFALISEPDAYKLLISIAGIVKGIEEIDKDFFLPVHNYIYSLCLFTTNI